MKTKKRIMSIAIDPRLRECLEAEALKENKSLSSVVETLLRTHFSISKDRPTVWKSNEEVLADMAF
jgi:hypothetical protein